MEATYDTETRAFTMIGRVWFDTYPIEDLPKWLTFYQQMQKDHPKVKGPMMAMLRRWKHWPPASASL